MAPDHPRAAQKLADEGWVSVPNVVGVAEAELLASRCLDLIETIVDNPEQREPRDKPVGGTLHLDSVHERIDGVDAVLDNIDLITLVEAALGPGFSLDMCSLRCPQPTYGGQSFHADDLPKMDQGPVSGLTAIVALTEFTRENGPTRLLPGSHLRPDIQREANSIGDHPDTVFATGPAGTAFLFSRHLLHSGTPNLSQQPRPALQIGWSRAGYQRLY